MEPKAATETGHAAAHAGARGAAHAAVHEDGPHAAPAGPRSGRGRGRRSARLGALAAALPLALTACGGGGDHGGGSADGKHPAKGPSKAAVHIAPKDGADGVDPRGALKVTADKGTLTRVRVTGPEGERISGSYARGRTAWKPADHLATDADYKVSAAAEDARGRRTTQHADFSTLRPSSTVLGRFTPEDGQKVGVGMPVSIDFDHAVSDKKAVQKSVSVTADPKAEVRGHWFGDSRLDFRPEDYWKAGTKVTLHLDLDGVESADGVYGTQRKDVTFTVGRRQVSVVDAKKKQMTVERDGKKIKNVPITSGTDQHPTYNGRMVVSEKHPVTRMDGDTVGFGRKEKAGGYDIKDVPHAMRLSTSGTFIHGNYWTPQGSFGHANLSHGCVGLFDRKGGGDSSTAGAWFFRKSIVGDVVEIKNSHDETVQPDNGLNGWNLAWKKWEVRQ